MWSVSGATGLGKRLVPSLLIALLVYNLLLFLFPAFPVSPTSQRPLLQTWQTQQSSSSPPPSETHPGVYLHLNPGDRENESLRQTEERMKKRVGVLRETCGMVSQPGKLMAKSLNNAALARTVLLEKAKLEVCVVFKAGSTSWAYFLAHHYNNTEILGNKKWYKMIDVLRPKYTKFQEITTSAEYMRVLMVREPMERILSAYRDRIQDQSHFSYQARHYGPLILGMVQGVRYSKKDQFHANGTLKIVPTFSEFVRFLVRQMPQDFDPHWRPIYLLCSICHINYTDIVHMETFKEDMHYVIRKTGLDTNVDENLLHTSKNKGRGNTQDLLVSFYSELEPSVLEQVVQFYRRDFLMLGYDPTSLLNRISPNRKINWKGGRF